MRTCGGLPGGDVCIMAAMFVSRNGLIVALLVSLRTLLSFKPAYLFSCVRGERREGETSLAANTAALHERIVCERN